MHAERQMQTVCDAVSVCDVGQCCTQPLPVVTICLSFSFIKLRGCPCSGRSAEFLLSLQRSSRLSALLSLCDCFSSEVSWQHVPVATDAAYKQGWVSMDHRVTAQAAGSATELIPKFTFFFFENCISLQIYPESNPLKCNKLSYDGSLFNHAQITWT